MVTVRFEKSRGAVWLFSAGDSATVVGIPGSITGGLTVQVGEVVTAHPSTNQQS
jgi:hypothetical protein